MLGGIGGLVGGTFLAGCSDDGLPGGADDPPPDEPSELPGSDVVTPERVAYGDDPSQYADLYRPAPGTDVDGQPSKGVVVVVHGGFWASAYDATLGAPLALSLAEQGWTAWNLEYRRVGDGWGGGGGYPTTFDDVAAGIDALADVDLTDAERACVLTLGHSAGGHLATWAAARGRYAPWSPVRVPVTGVVSQAGVLDLRAGLADPTARPNVLALMGGDDAAVDYAPADPAQQVPLDVPVRCVHGRDDRIVPIGQSQAYVEAALAAGADAELVEVEGDHFVVIDETSDAWVATLALLDGLRVASGLPG
ncbi:alpha/beta hydrolase [Nocardioides zeae]|uniref:Alpha/beta hydrolase n=1 Tax=Nocardioides imazamoxiresistens TaxID=3231893 RepID=A0ABU3PWA2_9ACTN|nr:alpha/beta hydrolase [Nocardioides zeae]MDT9593513.1 alpha/beta hydrolase [Nocardioides zeae]